MLLFEWENREMRVFFILISLLSFGLLAKPEKDFQLHCKSPWDWDPAQTAVFKYRDNDGAPRITGYTLAVRGHRLALSGEDKGFYPRYKSYDAWYIKPKYNHFKLRKVSYYFTDGDEDAYYFGEEINQDKEYGPKYELELYRKTLSVRGYGRCSFIDNEGVDDVIKLLKEWEREWQAKYPKPEEPKNKI